MICVERGDEALDLDRLVTLPDFAPPKTRRLFDDIKAVLPPPPVTKVEPTSPPPPPEATVQQTSGTPSYLPWIPIGVGVCAWNSIEPTAQIAIATRNTAGTSTRRPLREVPSSSTSSRPSTVAIQNERR